MQASLLVLCALAGASPLTETPTAETPTADTAAAVRVAALEKIAVIGASLSAGWGMDQNPDPFAESTISLAHVIEASLLAPHEPVAHQATAMFFLMPEQTAAAMLKKVRATQPSAIVALDYLFWFGYGDKGASGAEGADPKAREAKRLADLESGLESLAAFTCPILLGDLPDMRHATEVKQPMLSKPMVPEPATLKAMNERIAAWAKERKNVVVVPLHDMTAKLRADEEISLRGNTWPRGSAARLLQRDELHTTIEGTSAVWIMTVDAWLKADEDLPAGAFELDANKIAAKIAALPKPAAKPARKPAKQGSRIVPAGS